MSGGVKLKAGDKVTVFGTRGWDKDCPLYTTTVKKVLKYKVELENGKTVNLHDGEAFGHSAVRPTTTEHLEEIERYDLVRWACAVLREDRIKHMQLGDLQKLKECVRNMTGGKT